jgi:ATP-binding cassette, subfamily F, member 3
MLRITRLTYRIAGRVLFDGADATVTAGQRVGLVGRNGTGKTTLLRLIAGEIEPDSGTIETPVRWRIGVMAQEAPSGARSLLDTVLDADAELAALEAEAATATDPARIAAIHARLADKGAHAAPARAARILAGLGFDAAAQARPCAEFSGGWRMRVALAALLFTEPDLLLLDEPTNHLDLEATVWLEDFLRRYPGTVLLVSHDRDLLNNVPGHILHLDGQRLTLYAGNYDRFEETRRARLALDEAARARQEAERARILGFVERFRYKATKARQAQSRLKMLARMAPIPERREDGGIAFAFPEPEVLAPPLLTLDRVDAGYDGRAVLRRLSLRLDPDDRIALIGANGNGKSTLMRLLAGRLAPMAGAITRAPKLRVGYFAQHQAEELDLGATPLIELGRRRPREADERLRAQLGRFGFSQERAETPVGNLSGGEKARLLFALATSDAPHLLLLDEPTNHLDISAREALVQAINGFGGAVVIVSHDPHMIELIADRLWLVADGGVCPYDGDLADYRAMTLGDTGEDSAPTETPRTADPKREARRVAAERRRQLAPLKKRLDDAEAEVAKLEAEKAKLHATLADPALYQRDGARAAALQRELGETEKSLSRAEAAWLALLQAYEDAQAAPVGQ